jgi:hypothetical protein
VQREVRVRDAACRKLQILATDSPVRSPQGNKSITNHNRNNLHSRSKETACAVVSVSFIRSVRVHKAIFSRRSILKF